jgi:hypothetical protein
VLAVKHVAEKGGGIFPRWQAASSSASVAGAFDTSIAPHIDEILETDARYRRSLQEALVVPRNAEKRAAKVREMLRREWSEHTRGTAYATKKQMYSLVNKAGAPEFEWWDRVTGGVPFQNTSVDRPDVSQKLFVFLAPRLTPRCFPSSSCS